MQSRISPRRLALIGLMGAGKTEVGRQLARSLGWPFHDADRMVETEAGRSITEIFRTEGVAGFRERETEVVRALAGEPPPLIASLGGGVVERVENRDRLGRHFFVVWLRIDPPEAARRVGRDPARPLLTRGDPARTLEELARRREPFYRNLARLEVDAGGSTGPAELSRSIAAELAGSR